MEKKKSKIIEGLEKYLRETPEEQLKKDWEELEKYNQFGPDMEECLSRARARILDNMREEARALQIEEAAKALIGDDAKLIEVFRQGAEWSDDNPVNKWRLSELEQPDGERIVIAYDGNIASAEKYAKVYKAFIWCYLEDILPKKMLNKC